LIKADLEEILLSSGRLVGCEIHDGEERTGTMETTMETAVQGMSPAAEREGKYLTFALAGEEYGIRIRKVKEIIGLMNITGIPQAPPYLKGVINLRGKVIPVVELRLRFGLEEGVRTEKTCIIVVEVAGGESQMPVGIIVDSVSEVLQIREADVESTPDLGSSEYTRYILGMAKSESGVKILLDIDRLLNAADLMAGERS